MYMQDKVVGVIGAGTMGLGIATVAARSGYRTILHDVDAKRIEAGIASTKAFFERSVKLGKLTEQAAAGASTRLEGSTELSDVSAASVVIEAIYEDFEAKKDLMSRLDAIVGPRTLLHTNTSTLSVTGIASGSRAPERVVGTHYCNPAPLMKLVEVARGPRTSDWALYATTSFLASLDKTVVITKDRPGFIVNRFLIPWENSCIAALEAGLGTKESIDAAVTGALGHPMGPFRLLDIIGLDVHQQVATRLYEQLRDPRFFPPPMVDRMVAAGDLGCKSGHGFYDYDGTQQLFGS
jgi:3-hydroxybutyryl-CoA dehydrogenase